VVTNALRLRGFDPLRARERELAGNTRSRIPWWLLPGIGAFGISAALVTGAIAFNGGLEGRADGGGMDDGMTTNAATVDAQSPLAAFFGIGGDDEDENGQDEAREEASADSKDDEQVDAQSAARDAGDSDDSPDTLSAAEIDARLDRIEASLATLLTLEQERADAERGTRDATDEDRATRTRSSAFVADAAQSAAEADDRLYAVEVGLGQLRTALSELASEGDATRIGPARLAQLWNGVAGMDAAREQISATVNRLGKVDPDSEVLTQATTAEITAAHTRLATIRAQIISLDATLGEIADDLDDARNEDRRDRSEDSEQLAQQVDETRAITSRLIRSLRETQTWLKEVVAE
jgi:hypothetical protein